MDPISKHLLLSSSGLRRDKEYLITTFGGTESETIYGVAVDTESNVYSTGALYAGSNIGLLLTKHSPAGELIWARVLQSVGSSRGRKPAIDSDGNVYVAGYSSTGSGDGILVKYSTDGVMLWHECLGDYAYNTDIGVAIDGQSNVYVLVYAQTWDGVQIEIRKYSPSGARPWGRRVSGPKQVVGTDITTDPLGNIYVVGYTFDGSIRRGFLLKYDSDGVLQWNRSLQAGAYCDINAVACDMMGNVYLAGAVQNTTTSGQQAVAFKYTQTGALVWQRVLDRQYIAFSSITIRGEDLYAAGINDTKDAQIVNYNLDGALKWQRTLFISMASMMSVNGGIYADRNGGIYISGHTGTTGATHNSIGMFIIRLPNDGGLQGEFGNVTYSESDFSVAVSTVADSAGTLGDMPWTLSNSQISLYSVPAAVQTQTMYLPQTYWYVTNEDPTLRFENDDISIGSDGSIYVVGKTIQTGETSTAAISKFSSTGTLQWRRHVGESEGCRHSCVRVGADSSVYAAGENNRRAALTKYSSNGALLWQKVLIDSRYSSGTGCAVDQTGNVYLAGEHSLLTQTSIITVGFLAKYTQGGALLWQRAVHSMAGAKGVCVDSSGNAYITGGTSSGVLTLLKYSPDGVLQWYRQVSSPTETLSGQHLGVDAADNIYAVGTAFSGSIYRIVIVKYNQQGVIQWRRRYWVSSGTAPAGLSVSPSGEIYILGYDSIGKTFIVKLAYDGVIQWVREINETGVYASSISSSIHGNIAITGDNTRAASVIKLPGSGGLTGTYGTLTYSSTASLLTALETASDTAGALSDVAGELLGSDGTRTDSPATLITTKIDIQQGEY